jgi:hypothetical protein
MLEVVNDTELVLTQRHVKSHRNILDEQEWGETAHRSVHYHHVSAKLHTIISVWTPKGKWKLLDSTLYVIYIYKMLRYVFVSFLSCFAKWQHSAQLKCPRLQ